MSESLSVGQTHQKAKTAILFDAENISYRHVEKVLHIAHQYGKPILRAYADFSRPQTKGWEKPALKHGIRTIHQFSYDSKNSSSDFLMMHDAFKLMHSGKIETFVIVTCDKDFITPIQLLRQSGAFVHGIGLEDKASEILIESCNDYSVLKEREVTVTQDQQPSRSAPKKVIKQLVQTYQHMNKTKKGWVTVAMLRQRSDIPTTCYKKFSTFLQESGRFELSDKNRQTRLIT